MSNILDQIARGSASFRPRSTREYLALCIARSLNDVSNVREYAAAAEHVSEELLVEAAKRLRGSPSIHPGNAIECLREELESLTTSYDPE